MSRLYTVQFTGVAVTAQQDFFELTAGAAMGFRIWSFYLSQSTEVGDAQEEGLSILLKSGATVSGSGGSTPAIVPVDFGDAAAGLAAEANNTSRANTGTIVTHHAWNWNVRVPFQYIFLPEERPVMRVSRRCTLELATTPADSITMSGFILVEELG